MNDHRQHELKEAIRQVPNFPKPGINYYDITTVLKDPKLFEKIIDAFSTHYLETPVDVIVGIESRGFLFGAPLAIALQKPFIPIRKPGKLPAEVESIEYSLEYGTDTLEIHRDALSQNHRVILIDDLLATGGTAQATVELIERLGAEVIECAFFVELSFLKGREKLSKTPVISMVKYEE